MRVEKLKLMEYRNYEALTLAPGPKLNAIIGENAQGKTNVLEALFLCCFGRSHRTNKDADLIQRDSAAAYVGLDLTHYGGGRRIEMKFQRGEPKRALLDGKPLPRIGELIGVFHTVMFSPEDLTLVKQGPDLRRRFMDMELSQQSRSYFVHLMRYTSALRQKNAMLKLPARECPAGMAAAYDEQLALSGAELMRERAAFIERLAFHAKALHARISGEREALSVEYAPDVAVRGESVREAILDALCESAPTDFRRGFTGAGPHRDDIVLKLNGADARAFGSQGQQRTAALCLKLAQIELYLEQNSDAPVLLLDDVLSELDEERQGMLIAGMGKCQTFLTSTSLMGLEKLKGEMTLFECRAGTLRQRG
ncbi:MAG: DNA replication/repair protein RecF [Bacillota bacterium]